MSLLIALPFLAAVSAATCPVMDAALPTNFADWKMAPLDRDHRLTVGSAEQVKLQRSGQAKSGAPGFGGVMSFDIQAKGLYAFAASEPVWIDVMDGPKALTAAAHEHGAACTTIHKIVRFDLVPGHYQLKLSKSPKSLVKVKILAP